MKSALFPTIALLAILPLMSLKTATAQIGDIYKKNLTFAVSFDAAIAPGHGRGTRKFQFAEDVSRKKFLKTDKIDGVTLTTDGKFGGAVDFTKKTKEILCYSAKGNFPYSQNEFDASISFWMKCDPGKLPKGYIDPLQITDKKWNDASIFVDFNDKRPADFRLGVFSNFKFWNPENRKFDSLKPEERPMVDAGKVKFSGDKWTHVGLVFKGINTSGKSSQSTLYIDGKQIGTLDRKQKFSWNVDNAYIMLGIYYVGQLDDFAIFDVALTDEQIRTLVTSNKPVNDLVK